MAQLVLGAVGAVVGSFFAMPQLGWAIGSALGGMVGGKTQKSQGPRLSDLKVTGTEYGQPIPYVQGHPGIAGQIWWASERREIATTTSVGKGGPSAESTTYTYEVDLLIGLTDNVIEDVPRIWSNGQLIYTKLAASPTESVLASASSELWTRMTVYTGAASQMPDPTYEAAVGTANAPAYRGRGSVFIESLQLGSSGQIPNLTFEVCTSTTPAGITPPALVAEIPTFRDFNVGTPSFDPDGYYVHVGQFTNGYENKDVAVYHVIGSAVTGPLGTFSVPGTNNEQNAGSGTTDVSCYVTYRSSTQTRMFSDLGTAVDFTTGANLSDPPSIRFSRKGGDVVLGYASGGVTTVWRFSTAGGAALATSASMPTGAKCIAIGASKVFVLLINQIQVLQLNLSTLALEATIAYPVGHPGEWIYSDDSDGLYFLTDDLFRYNGSGWDTISTTPGQIQTTQYSNSNFVAGVFYTINGSGTSGGETIAQIYAAATTVTVDNETLLDVVSRLCLRAGMAAGHFDVTALSAVTKPVRALAISQVGSTRAVLEMLAAGYFFECVLSDKLYFRPRGAAAAATIAYADLGASSNPAGAAEPLALRPANDLEVPAVVVVSYMDVDADYERGTQSSDRIRSTSKTIANLELALGFTAAEAKAIADTMVMDQAASALASTKISLLDTYARLEPTDPILATAEDGSTFRLRLVKLTSAAGVRDFEAVIDDASVLSSAGITMPAATPTTSVSVPTDTLIELMDIPILRDADDAPGIYVAAKGATTPYPGAVIYRSPDDVSYEQVATVTESAVFGTASTTLGNFAAGSAVVDETNRLTVDVGAGELASSSRAAMFADASVNAMLVGSEVIRFITATLVSPGVYTLSGLLRGQRGTEWAIAGHAAAERVVPLRMTGMRRVISEVTDLGVQRWYKGVTFGRRLSTAVAETLTDTGVALMPFSPVDARGSRDGEGNMVLAWKRRTRFTARFAGAAGILVPLGEASESYEVDIYSSSGFTTVLRTITSTTPTVSYTPDMQITDFGAAQQFIYAKIYQLNATIGRGYPLQASVDFGAAVAMPVIYYTGTAVARAVNGNIDTRTGGAILLKGLTPVGEPNGVLLSLSGVAVTLNTSAVSPAVTYPTATVTTFGVTFSASSPDNSANRKAVAVFLPKRAGVFERVSWTGNGAGARAISHAMGVAPSLALVKRRDTTDPWLMYSSQAGANMSLTFPTAAGAAFIADVNSFPSASTSTVLNVGSTLNVSGALYEALLFPTSTADVAAEGTYTGNGSASGPTVTLTFQPRLLLIRSLGATNRFTFITSDQLSGSGYTHWMLDDQGGAAATAALVTLSATGFTVASTDGTVNENAVSYQYIALAAWA